MPAPVSPSTAPPTLSPIPRSPSSGPTSASAGVTDVQIRATVRHVHELPGLSEKQRSVYPTWVRRYLRALTARTTDRPSDETLEAFLTWLDEADASVQEQREAREALTFFHDVVLRRPVAAPSRPRQLMRQRPASYLSDADQGEVLLRLRGADRLMARLAFEANLTPLEVSEVRVGDLSLPRPTSSNDASAAWTRDPWSDGPTVVVRDASGRTVRRVPLSAELAADLQQHLRRVRHTFERDRASGCAAAPIPLAVAGVFPDAEESWEWQMVFPASTRSRDARTGRSVRPSTGPGLLIEALRSLSRTNRRAFSAVA